MADAIRLAGQKTACPQRYGKKSGICQRIADSQHFSIENVHFQSGRRRHFAEKAWFFRSFGALARLRGPQSIYLISSDKCSKERWLSSHYPKQKVIPWFIWNDFQIKSDWTV
ncbi:hypothetical protein [uncultured Desulfovibrio sp.]|uniref:hypothetical protein n=1 Tax=uncultured Desulfovibrio sp. TaxID=167968 RepID=UPI002638E92B|nr:hypothetical protein [uncultured Desulfovibrio sp.]